MEPGLGKISTTYTISVSRWRNDWKNKYISLFLLKPIQHVMLDLYVEWYYDKYDYLVLFTAMFHIIWGLLSTTGTTDNSFDTAHSTELVAYTRIQRTLYRAHNWTMSGWRYHVNILQRRKSIYSIYCSVFIAVYQSSITITVQYHAVRYKHHESDDGTKPLPEPMLTWSVRWCGIHMIAISQKILMIFIIEMSLKFTHLRL